MHAFEVVCRRRSQRFVADCGKMDSLRAAPKMVELGEKILPSAEDITERSRHSLLQEAMSSPGGLSLEKSIVASKHWFVPWQFIPSRQSEHMIDSKVAGRLALTAWKNYPGVGRSHSQSHRSRTRK